MSFSDSRRYIFMAIQSEVLDYRSILRDLRSINAVGVYYRLRGRVSAVSRLHRSQTADWPEESEDAYSLARQ